VFDERTRFHVQLYESEFRGGANINRSEDLHEKLRGVIQIHNLPNENSHCLIRAALVGKKQHELYDDIKAGNMTEFKEYHRVENQLNSSSPLNCDVQKVINVLKEKKIPTNKPIADEHWDEIAEVMEINLIVYHRFDHSFEFIHESHPNSEKPAVHLLFSRISS